MSAQVFNISWVRAGAGTQLVAGTAALGGRGKPGCSSDHRGVGHRYRSHSSKQSAASLKVSRSARFECAQPVHFLLLPKRDVASLTMTACIKNSSAAGIITLVEVVANFYGVYVSTNVVCIVVTPRSVFFPSNLLETGMFAFNAQSEEVNAVLHALLGNILFNADLSQTIRSQPGKRALRTSRPVGWSGFRHMMTMILLCFCALWCRLRVARILLIFCFHFGVFVFDWRVRSRFQAVYPIAFELISNEFFDGTAGTCSLNPPQFQRIVLSYPCLKCATN